MAYTPKYLRKRKRLECICGRWTRNVYPLKPDGWELVHTEYPRCPTCTQARRAYYAEVARRKNPNNRGEFANEN